MFALPPALGIRCGFPFFVCAGLLLSPQFSIHSLIAVEIWSSCGRTLIVLTEMFCSLRLLALLGFYLKKLVYNYLGDTWRTWSQHEEIMVVVLLLSLPSAIVSVFTWPIELKSSTCSVWWPRSSMLLPKGNAWKIIQTVLWITRCLLQDSSSLCS